MILDSAAAVFQQKGFIQSTIGDIADRAEIAKGTIYLYFKSKADLYFNLTKPAIENLSKRLKKIAADKSASPEEKIRDLVYAVYDFYAQDTDAYNLITNYKSSEYQNLLPKARLRVLENQMRSNLKQMEIVIGEGMRKGVLNKINPYSGAVLFWSSFIGIIKFQENRMMPGKKDYRKADAGPVYIHHAEWHEKGVIRQTRQTIFSNQIFTNRGLSDGEARSGNKQAAIISCLEKIHQKGGMSADGEPHLQRRARYLPGRVQEIRGQGGAAALRALGRAGHDPQGHLEKDGRQRLSLHLDGREVRRLGGRFRVCDDHDRGNDVRGRHELLDRSCTATSSCHISTLSGRKSRK